MLRAVIFDVDGVLIDSVASAYRVKTALLERHGVDIREVPDEHGEGHKGNSLKVLFAAVKKSHGLLLDAKHAGPAVVEAVYQDLLAHNVTIETGLLQLLEELKAQRIPCAIVSSGLRQSIMNKLDILGIADYLSIIVSAEDVEAHKPDPASYQLAVQRLAVNPTDCVAFEDSKAGVQAAEGAGVVTVGFTKFSTNKTLATKSGLNIDDWQEIDYQTLRRLITR